MNNRQTGHMSYGRGAYLSSFISSADRRLSRPRRRHGKNDENQTDQKRTDDNCEFFGSLDKVFLASDIQVETCVHEPSSSVPL